MAACCSTDRRPTSDPKRRRSRRRSAGHQPLERARDLAVGRRRVRGRRGRRRRRRGPRRRRRSRARRRSARWPPPWRRARRSTRAPRPSVAAERVQRRDDLEGVLGIAAIERRHARVAVGRALDEAAVLQAREGLADRGAADAQPRGQLGVAQLLAGLQRAVEDRVAQPRVGLVAQQHAGRDGLARGNRHVKYHTPLVKRQLRSACLPPSGAGRRAATMHRNGTATPGVQGRLHVRAIEKGSAPSRR